ncbi:monosaccharide ABC transporter membrane protein (CUT2 family) [Bacillus oleivorans]|uniref:Monosaccharide ABC transporter membrane protein (CUT2 family) n=1 Tax=Bacillus oleivorans TaxID=1448271 RepID=A0A285CPC3_9BACI|nr:ABC transporter permease [Bacillus oleivorans]SNX69430.1 monosaccharide ABC transporter membrane protein (CUT2 family) [Bacillus oleivorans]
MSNPLNINEEKKRLSLNKDFIGNYGDLTLLFFIMIGVFAIMAIINPSVFLSEGMMISIANQFPILGLLTLAMMFAMVSGGIDLSVVSTANLSAIMASIIMVQYIPEGASSGVTILYILLAIAVALLVGCVAGLINGFLVTVVRIPAIIVTLGTMQLYMGIALVLTKGKSIVGLPTIVSEVSSSRFLGIPFPLVIFIIFVFFSYFVLNLRDYGLRLQMTGSNPVAAKFSGLNVNSITIKAYVISGLLSAIAGLLMTAATNAAKADFGTTYLLQAILVAVMGGVNPYGGRGKVAGVVMAVITMQILSSGLGMLKVSNFFKDFMWGTVLIIVLLANLVYNKKISKLT